MSSSKCRGPWRLWCAVVALFLAVTMLGWRFMLIDVQYPKDTSPTLPSSTLAHAPPRRNIAWVHEMSPIQCAGGGEVVLHRPRDNSSVQTSPFDSSRQCCTPVKDDIDKGLTMYHLLVRYVCSVHHHHTPDEWKSTGVVPRVRLLQIGANTGDNDNDHLFRFLKRRQWAEAVLLEPVPWLFEKLQQAYRGFDAEVTPVNAAMAKEDGRLPFFAPLPDAPGWVKQMGGFVVTPRNMNVLRRKKLTHLIKETSVATMSMRTVLHQRGWEGKLPHVVVIDTEGFDAHVMEMLLDTMLAASKTERIPIIQYEWKHLAQAVNDGLITRLVGLGYCVLKVHYDVLAYHAATMEPRWPENCAAAFALPS